ncbi:SNF2 family helicase [Nitzschia inconspicua]|uniref:SNF2 family helicase n=1 Tax=Nitzschia inconspicua TaxID=303405 RepID=A0A9K3PXC4_9STRA|nr:SNF2 family helicase [Nitzschia inconspicua]
MNSLTSRVCPVDAHRVSLEGRELGYVCLEDCDVWFMENVGSEEKKHQFASERTSSSSCWIDVSVPLSHRERKNLSKEEQLDDGKSISSVPGNACPHCCVILTNAARQNETSSQYYFLAGGPSYDGTIQDTKPSNKACRCKVRPRQRSDAALMLGAALASHDIGHFNIRSIKVGRHSSPKEAIETVSSELKKEKVTILVTFTCLEIVRKSTRNGAFEQRAKRRFITNSAKPFPASTQLLLCLMSSDWKAYDEKITNLQSSQKTRVQSEDEISSRRTKTATSFFPSKMTLENVYQRIGGASALSDLCLDEDIVSRDSGASSKEQIVDITMLPQDVLCHRIGSFLRARSVDALRCTCKRMHGVLRGVVPGLKLQLYRHQIKSLLWMRWRETKLLRESDLTPIENQSMLQRRINSREGDAHRAATGGGSAVLCPREQKDGVRISQANGDELETPEEGVMSRPLARGGMICDAPGLGKTITVLSLILQTIGLTTESADTAAGKSLHGGERMGEGMDEGKEHSFDDQIFNAYWKENVVEEFRRQELSKLFSTFLRCSAEIFYFFEKIDPFSRNGTVQNPTSLKDIKERIQSDTYGDSFVAFQTDVKLCFMNAMLAHDPDHVIHVAARRLTIIFAGMVKDFKEKQTQIAKKSFAKSTRRPDSVVAALVETTSAERIKAALLPSSGTLLVVPSVLLDHWFEQLRLHVNPVYCTDKIPLIFEYTGSNEKALQMEEIVTQCKVAKTHFGFLFIDKTGSKKLPSASFLTMFQIVITTNHRFSNEWRNGSFEDELKSKEGNKNDESLDIFGYIDKTEREACPLLKVNWLRMIVDEGHSMGRGKDNSHISFASWVNAERRWAMTGTPTRQTITQSGLSNVLNLMQYLNHNFFTRRHGGDVVWNQLIVRGWNRGYMSSFYRLRSLLSLLMVRHTKGDIEELAPPIYKVIRFQMSQEEVSTYNTLVCAVQSNLLITSMRGKTSGAQDSLLHKSQTKHAREALANLRLVCVGGTKVHPTLSDKNWNEFLEMFDAINEDRDKRQAVRDFIARATTGQLSSCNCCQMMLSSLLVFPCGHLVCTECIDNTTTSCIVCDTGFDVDHFQKLQPGFAFEWMQNIEEERQTRPTTNDDQELDDNRMVQHMQLNDDDAEIHFGGFLPQQNRARQHKPGDGHTCVFSARNPDGGCRLCSRQHEECYLIEEDHQCKVCYRKWEKCPAKETKPHYVVSKLLKLYREQQESEKSVKFKVPIEFSMESRRPLKVIVFSQFRKTLNQTGDRLLRRFGNGCVAEYWGMYRKRELHKFVHDKKCFCMLLGKDGSEGLDLSFVTHIIFLEQVWDKSLESQAVSRAWRMGAKGPVNVETLIAMDSIEETMASLEKGLEHDDDDDNASFEEVEGVRSVSDGNKASEYQRAKMHYLLKNLKLISNSNTLGFAGREKRTAAALEKESESMGSNHGKKKKSRSEEVRVRFQEHHQTYEYDVN